MAKHTDPEFANESERIAAEMTKNSTPREISLAEVQQMHDKHAAQEQQ